MTKKKYSIHWEDDNAVSFEVDGVHYANLEDVPEEKDRLKLEAMIDSTSVSESEAEFKNMNEQDQPSGKASPENIIVGVFTGVAVLLLLVAVLASANNIIKINREESAAGTVVDLTKRLQYDEEDHDRVVGEAYFPIVEFTAKDGRQRQVQLSEGSFPPMYEVGDEVTVLYEPDRPSDARIKSGSSTALMWILPGITGVLGIAFLAAVIAAQRFLFSTGANP